MIQNLSMQGSDCYNYMAVYNRWTGLVDWTTNSSVSRLKKATKMIVTLQS